MTSATDTAGATFPLAVLVARVLGWALLVIGVISGGAWIFTRGPAAGFNLMTGYLVLALSYFAFAYFLKKGSKVAAVLFALWCAWGLLDSISGADDPIVAILGYLFGVLNFVGLAAIVKGYISRNRLHL
jgi:hypothetical protein